MIEGLVESLAAPGDPRRASKAEHRSVDVPVVAACAAVAEAETFAGIAPPSPRGGPAAGLPRPARGHSSRDTFRRAACRRLSPPARSSAASWPGCARRPAGKRTLDPSGSPWTAHRCGPPSTAGVAARPRARARLGAGATRRGRQPWTTRAATARSRRRRWTDRISKAARSASTRSRAGTRSPGPSSRAGPTARRRPKPTEAACTARSGPGSPNTPSTVAAIGGPASFDAPASVPPTTPAVGSCAGACSPARTGIVSPRRELAGHRRRAGERDRAWRERHRRGHGRNPPSPRPFDRTARGVRPGDPAALDRRERPSPGARRGLRRGPRSRAPSRRIAPEPLHADASTKASLKGERKTAGRNDAHRAKPLEG